MEIQEILNECTVSGNIIKLPSYQLDRKDYLEIKKRLEYIGGKWKGGKTQGFVFESDPTNLFEEIKAGANRNLKKEYQFFETPVLLADELVRLAEININHSVLEPSAGRGAIVKAIHRMYPLLKVDCFELNETNCTILNGLPNTNVLANDFLNNSYTNNPKRLWDTVIANPPFSKNQDIDHIYKMYAVTNPNKGMLVTLCSKHYLYCNNKKETQFREWLKTVNAKIINIPAGTFKESGTNIETQIIIIKK